MKTAITLIIAAIALAMIGWALGTAKAHEAPTGWSYGYECCSNRDCAVEVDEVRATEQGWLITRLGLTISYNDRKVKESKDGDFHTCFRLNQRDDPDSLLCLYTPPMGF